MPISREDNEAERNAVPGTEAQGELEALDDEAPEAEGEGEDASEPKAEQEAPAKNQRWLNRKSISALRREMADQSFWRQYDQRDNDESRLPPGEEVHLAGLVLVEAFTPSSASLLKKALEELPKKNNRKVRWQADIEEGRSAAGRTGWDSPGVIRRKDEFGFENSDLEMPDAVEAIWPNVFWVTPSLTIVVAIFTLEDGASDLSALLRADYATSASKPRIRVKGRLGRVRCHIPWSRPKSWSGWHDIHRADENRTIACESVISKHEDACLDWFSKRFPGVFSTSGRKTRPTARILITKERVPFEGDHRPFEAVGLSQVLDVWNSTDQPGWKLSFSDASRARRHILTFAARGKDVARSPGGGIAGDSIWYLTSYFSRIQSLLVARWAITRLLSLYTNRLASLRDRAGRSRRIRWPVREARDLDKFLIRDGLDASTIISDLDMLTYNLSLFRLHVVEYSEDMSRYPQNKQNAMKPAELVPALYERIKSQAVRLKKDMEAATSNIAASAQLRQAIANTRLQRSVIVLTIFTIAVALASLYVSLHPGSVGYSRPQPTHATHVSSSHSKRR